MLGPRPKNPPLLSRLEIAVTEPRAKNCRCHRTKTQELDGTNLRPKNLPGWRVVCRNWAVDQAIVCAVGELECPGEGRF